MAGLYLHIPFCRQACHYCDFHFSTNLAPQNELVRSISRELAFQKDYLEGEPLSSIYFGGGTPSLLDESQFTLLFDTIFSNFEVSAEAEITLEANPDDLSKSKLKSLHQFPVNRLSIGIQTFSNELLKFLNRSHTAQQAIDSFMDARSFGYNNISVDLIFGIPGLSPEHWESTVKQALDLRPEHLSCYGLTVEPRTFFGKQLERGLFEPMREVDEADQYILLMKMAEANDFEHYEISNFARPGFRAHHNSNYWKRIPYLGVGPGAHSYNGKSRQHNIPNNAIYVKHLAESKVPFTKEELTWQDKVNEFVMTSLRTSEGLDLFQLRSEFGIDLEESRGDFMATLVGRGLASIAGSRLTLTREGKCMADNITSELFVLTETRAGSSASGI